MDQPLDLAPVRIETTHPDSPRPGERSEITKARRVGHAITRNESFAGAAGVGVPIIGTDGLAIGSISVAWLGDDLDETSAADALRRCHCEIFMCPHNRWRAAVS